MAYMGVLLRGLGAYFRHAVFMKVVWLHVVHTNFKSQTACGGYTQKLM